MMAYILEEIKVISEDFLLRGEYPKFNGCNEIILKFRPEKERFEEDIREDADTLYSINNNDVDQWTEEYMNVNNQINKVKTVVKILSDYLRRIYQ